MTDHQWTTAPPKAGSYRSIFKWGAPERFSHPGRRLMDYLSTALALDARDKTRPRATGEQPVAAQMPSRLSKEQLAALIDLAGAANVDTSTYGRLRHSTGKTTEEALTLRAGALEGYPVADAVVHPRRRRDVVALVQWCHRERIPLTVYGGGSSVCLGLQCPAGGIILVMQTHMNRLVALNEANRTVTVEAGMLGPAYERLLNTAPRSLGAAHPYTGGHFPQSFEHSSVGGWVATLGSGQLSSYYGDACDLVVGQDVVTPAGEVVTLPYPGTATGPKVNDILTGSEGAFGVVVAVTMKIFRYRPETRKRFSFIFPTWASAVAAMRDISQAECGMPALLRISDPEETDVAMHHYGLAGTPVDRYLIARGLKPGSRCLCIGRTEGERGFSRNINRVVRRIARGHGGVFTTGYPVRRWEHGRFSDPYMREDLNDLGISIDTLETGVAWDQLAAVHERVRRFVKNRPHTVCMTHCSHFYGQGTNLYFIFIGRFRDLADFRAFHRGIVTEIVAAGGSLSHHHGVGKLLAPWMKAHLGSAQMAVLQTLKTHFDPRGIMNPGGTLGLRDGRGENHEGHEDHEEKEY
ncbi:MAG: FAD-binding oxidoreductase [Pseudomonadota bacterium]